MAAADGLDRGHVGAQFDVDEDRHGPVLDDRIDGRGETGGDGDDFVAGPDAALAQRAARSAR